MPGEDIEFTKLSETEMRAFNIETFALIERLHKEATANWRSKHYRPDFEEVDEVA